MLLLRSLLSILLLPFVMVVIVPSWLLARWDDLDTRWTGTAEMWIGRGAGGLLLVAGFALFLWCVILFGRVGKGTLAPWDPTRRLVAVGPYRYMRNPMITSVAAMLTGEAAFFGSRLLAIWGLGFLLLNHLHFLLIEEPGLVRRFGESYTTYKKHVPRWVPRLTPWQGS